MNKQLTEEIVGSASRRGVLLSVLGTLLIVFLVNVAASLYLKNYTTNRGYWLIAKKWEMLFGLKRPVDWLILGDSSCNQGVDPDILDKKLGVTSINLCTVGNMLAVNDVWMLNKYIQQFGAPRNVLIVHVYDIWSRDVNPYYLAKVPLDWGYWRQMEPPLNLSFKEMTHLFIGRYVPLYADNLTLSELLKSPLMSIKKNSEYRLEENGFMIVSQPQPQLVKKALKASIEFHKQNKPKFSMSNRQALDRITALAEKHSFDVYIANSPLYEELYENKEFQAYNSQVQKTLNAYVAKSERVHNILQEPMTFSIDQMDNVDHLIYSAAPVYTNGIVAEIMSIQKGARDEGRWEHPDYAKTQPHEQGAHVAHPTKKEYFYKSGMHPGRSPYKVHSQLSTAKF